jgi:hypothetical protein
MKYGVVLMTMIFSFSAQAWINNVYYIKGKIKSFDQNFVGIESLAQNTAQIPRAAIPKTFPLAANDTLMMIPVSTKEMSKVKWRLKPTSAKFDAPRFSAKSVARFLDTQYEKAKKR